MWLIEFLEGNLSNLILPIDNKITLTGSKSDETNSLYIPEYLSKNEKLYIKIENNIPFFYSKKYKDNKKLISNKIYYENGLNFLVYKEGERKNKNLIFLNIKKYWLFITLLFVSNLLITGFILYINNIVENKLFSNRINLISTGYIKQGKLYLFKNKNTEKLPNIWKKNSDFIGKKSDYIISQFNIKIVNSENKEIKFKVINRKLFDEIKIDTFEKDNKIMSFLGANDIAFKKEKNLWLVNNLDKAKVLFSKEGFSQEIKNLKNLNKEFKIINSNNFPYFIFYSDKSTSYIYNKKQKFWVGSIVPVFGKIHAILPDKIIFKSKKQTKTYFIK